MGGGERSLVEMIKLKLQIYNNTSMKVQQYLKLEREDESVIEREKIEHQVESEICLLFVF